MIDPEELRKAANAREHNSTPSAGSNRDNKVARDPRASASVRREANARLDEAKANKQGLKKQLSNNVFNPGSSNPRDDDDDDNRQNSYLSNHILKNLLHKVAAVVAKAVGSYGFWAAAIYILHRAWDGIKHFGHRLIQGAKNAWHKFANWAGHNKILAATVKGVKGAWTAAGTFGKGLMIAGAISGGGATVYATGTLLNDARTAFETHVARMDGSCSLLDQVAQAFNDATKDEAASGGASGSWKDNGKKIFDHLVKTDGFSGAGAAGAVGNAAQESQCNPTAYNPGGNVIGIFQWGNGGVNGDRFEKGGFCKNDDKSTWTIDNELKLTDYELDHGYHACKVKVGHESDPKEAAHIWAGRAPDGFEGAPGQAEGAREDYAQQAYSAFNGSSISANDSLLGASASDTATGNDGASATNNANKCNGKSGDEGGAADGTGSIKESSPSGTLRWRRDQVPDDVKPYIHDPEKAGLSWGSAKGWSTPGGQCVDLSVSLFHAIWKGAPGHLSGNGRDMANSAAAAFHGSTSKTPHAGSIVSQVGGGADPTYGHTYIVEHVLANGDIICVEQNVAGYSGDSNGTPETWDFLWISKDYYSKYDTFFTPSGSPNWNGV